MKPQEPPIPDKSMEHLQNHFFYAAIYTTQQACISWAEATVSHWLHVNGVLLDMVLLHY